jgi:outer membrane protein TolC
VEKDVAARIEGFVAGVIEQYYSVWLMQTNYRAAADRYQRNRRLLKVTEVKARRGTAEQSDLLQIKSSVSQSRQQMQDLRKKLQDVWRSLVVAFNLPDRYLGYDVTQVQLVRDSRVEQSQKFCEGNSYSNSNAIEALQTSLEASNFDVEAIKANARPDLFFEARLASNGIDQDFAEPTADAMSYKNPQLSFAIGLDWPIGLSQDKASYLDVFSRQRQLEVSINQLKSNQKVDWLNSCEDLKRLKEKLKSSEQVLSWQKKRNNLEENRFELGQVDLFNVIQSGNDVTTAEVGVKSTLADLDIMAWNVIQLQGSLPDYIKSSLRKFKKRPQ